VPVLGTTRSKLYRAVYLQRFVRRTRKLAHLVLLAVVKELSQTAERSMTNESYQNQYIQHSANKDRRQTVLESGPATPTQQSFHASTFISKYFISE